MAKTKTVARPKAKRRTSQPQPESYRIYSSPRTTAGVWIDADTALRNDVVWACIRYLTGVVAQLPWRVMQATDDGADKVPTHPVDYVIGTRPNPEMSSFTFRETLLANALLWGNGYAEIERDAAARLVALHYIHPCRVQPRRDETGRLIYEITNYSGGPSYLTPENIYHVRGFGEGPVGYNVIQYAAQTIGWAQATMLFGASYFGQGMNPSGIVEIPGALSREAMTLLDENMTLLYGGPKGKRTMYLDKGMKFTPITIQPNDSQFVESIQQQIEAICRIFGVPPHKVMHLLRSTFSNIENQNIEVVVDTITPWVKRFEEEADYKLFGQNRSGFFTKMALQGLLRGDSVSRSAWYKAMVELGAFTINDVLRLEDENTIGEEGDRRFVSTNVVPLDLIDQKFAMDNKPKPAPAAATNGTDEQPPMNFSAARTAARNGNGHAH